MVMPALISLYVQSRPPTSMHTCHESTHSRPPLPDGVAIAAELLSAAVGPHLERVLVVFHVAARPGAARPHTPQRANKTRHVARDATMQQLAAPQPRLIAAAFGAWALHSCDRMAAECIAAAAAA